MSAFHGTFSFTGARETVSRRVGRTLRRAVHGVGLAWRAMTSRRDLVEIDDRMLQDLGISRAQANFEAGRAPWHIRPYDHR